MRREWAFGPSQAAMVKGKTRPAANERPRARLNPSLSPPSPSAGWAASRATSRATTQARAKERMASVDGMRGGTKTGRGGADAAGRVERKKENAGVMIGSGTKNLPAQKKRGPRGTARPRPRTNTHTQDSRNLSLYTHTSPHLPSPVSLFQRAPPSLLLTRPSQTLPVVPPSARARAAAPSAPPPSTAAPGRPLPVGPDDDEKREKERRDGEK